MADQEAPALDEFLGVKEPPVWRRYAIMGGIALGVVLLALLSLRLFGGSDAPHYATQAVERGDLTVTVSATGKLAPTNQVTVGSQLSGLIKEVLVDVNDRVTAGQPIALIDPDQLDDAIRQSQASLNANLAGVAQAQATLEEARAQLGRLQEVHRLSNGRTPAKTEMEAAEAAVARGVASVRTAQANVEAARAQLSSNQTQRTRAVIRSPVNGVVLARQIEPGQTVAASFNTPTLFVIAQDLSQMKLEVAIDEADVGQVEEGQRASFAVDAFPGETFPAKITRVDLGSNLSAESASSSSSSSGDGSSSGGQVVSYAAILSVANPELRLRPGMTATAEIVTTESRNVLLVPNAALRFTPASGAPAVKQGGGMTSALMPRRRRGRDGGGQETTIKRGSEQTLYVLGENGEPQAVRIVTGNTNGVVTEVTGGDLKPDMQVITGQLLDDAAVGSQRQGGPKVQVKKGG